jgi:hypothetical protein
MGPVPAISFKHGAFITEMAGTSRAVSVPYERDVLGRSVSDA